MDRRRALRVPVRGDAILHGDHGPLHARLENLSESGMLLSSPVPPNAVETGVEVELRMLGGGGWISGEAVRVVQIDDRWGVGIQFNVIEPVMAQRITAAIEAALSTVQARPILVVDDLEVRREALVAQLARHGLMPLAPKTPLEVIDVLTRPQLHVGVCMLSDASFASAISDSFPWVTTQAIDDDVAATALRALDAWWTSPMARLGVAIS